MIGLRAAKFNSPSNKLIDVERYAFAYMLMNHHRMVGGICNKDQLASLKIFELKEMLALINEIHETATRATARF